MKLSVRQIIASAIGAVLSALIASFFGVKGTVIGVAIGSVVATTGTALVAQSIDRTHRAVRQVVVTKSGPAGLVRHLGWTRPAGRATHGSVDAPGALHAGLDAGQTVPAPAAEDATGRADRQRPIPRADHPRARRSRWPVLAAAVVGVFVLALLVVTGVEVIAGKPLSSLFGVGGSPTTGASVSNLFDSSGATTTSTTTTVPSTTTTAPSSSTTTSTGGAGGAISSTSTTVPSSATTGVSGTSTTTGTTAPTGSPSTSTSLGG